MSRVVNVVAGLVGIIAVFGFWFLVIVVIPGIVALYAAGLFPLTGQWRKRWADRRGRKPSG